jgi:hypothetical protein
MVTTILNKDTGEVLFSTDGNYHCLENEVKAPFNTEEFLLKGYFDFKNQIYCETATPQELAEYRKSLVPQEVQLWRIRTILKSMRFEDSIQTVLNNLEEPTKTAALCIWNYGSTVERNSQTVAMLKTALQLTDEQVDEMFIEANNIKL